MKKVGIIGASGYTGGELLRLLLRHKHVEIKYITSESLVGKPVHEAHSFLRNTLNISFESYNLDKIREVDIVFLCVPHGIAMDFASDILALGKKVIDFSADFRIKDFSVYEKWYKKHSQKNLLDKAAYGLPEINRLAIEKANLIANPGCYATSVIIPVFPFAKENLISNKIIVDAKSGVSGAGKKNSQMYIYNEANENITPYNINKHRHIPEIQENISVNENIEVIFSPQLVPMTKGIISSIYIETKDVLTEQDITSLYKKYYSDKFFIRIYEPNNFPEIKSVRNTNFCDIGFCVNGRTIILFSCIDNLLKGASGQAVQNMNIAFGFDEREGLI